MKPERHRNTLQAEIDDLRAEVERLRNLRAIDRQISREALAQKDPADAVKKIVDTLNGVHLLVQDQDVWVLREHAAATLLALVYKVARELNEQARTQIAAEQTPTAGDHVVHVTIENPPPMPVAKLAIWTQPTATPRPVGIGAFVDDKPVAFLDVENLRAILRRYDEMMAEWAASQPK